MIKKTRKWHISKITQEEFAKQYFLKELFSGRCKLAILYGSDCDSYEILSKICNDPKSEINYSNPNDYYSFLWKAKIIFNYLYQIPVQMDQDFYFFEIEKIISKKTKPNEQNTKELKKFVQLKNDLQFFEKSLKNMCTQTSLEEGLDMIEHLLNLKKEDFNFIYVLQPSITKYMKKINIKKKKLKFSDYKISPLDILSIYRDISEDELQTYIEDISIFSEGDNFKSLMTQLFLNNENFYLQLQNILSSYDLVPYFQSQLKSLLLNPIYECSEILGFYILANQSLLSKEHFVDIFWKKKIKYLITHFSDREKPFITNSQLVDLYPFFIVACFEQIYPDKDVFNAVRTAFSKENIGYSKYLLDKINIVEGLFERVENDENLLSKIKGYLNYNISINYLVSISIPKLFHGHAVSYDDEFFQSIFDTKYFLISEADIQKDESFFYSPKIYNTIIDYVISKKDETEFPEYLKNYKEHFKVDEIRKKIFIDIYSLIFFQDQNNEYYCTIEKADDILKFLIFFNVGKMTNEEQYLIKNSRQHIAFSQLKGKHDLKSAIFSYENYLVNLITSGKEEEFQTAKALVPTLGSSKLKTIIQILTFRENSDDSSKIEDQYKYSFAVENHFSLEISRKSNENKYTEEEEINEKENIFNDWLTDQQLIDMQKYFSENIMSFIDELNDLHSNYNNPLDILLKKKNYLHTSTWRAYLKLYAKFEKAVKNDKNNQHYDSNKKLEPAEIVQILHKSEIETNMNNLDTLLGPHALEFLLLYTPSFNDKIYKLVESKSPITAQVIRYEFALKGNYTNSNKDSVYEHLLAKKAGYDDDEFIIISTDFEALADSHDSTLSSFTNKEINDLIERYAYNNPIQTNTLNQIFLREPTIYTQKMKNIVRNDFERFTIDILLDLYPFCGLKSLPFLKKLNVKIIDEQNIMFLLIEKTRWTTIRLFIDDLKYIYDIDKESETNEIDDRILLYVTNYIKKHHDIVNTIPKDILTKIDVDQIINSSPQQDYETCYVIESISDLNYYLRSNEDFDVNETIDMINRLLQPLVIDNNFRELIQRQIHKLSFLFSKRFKHSFATKLRALSSMLYRDLLGRYGIVISLSNFSKETFGSHVAKIYLKYDFFKECQEICAAWSLDISVYKAEMALSAFKIGLVNEGMSFISPPIRNDQLVDQLVDILSNKFIFDYSPVVDVTQFKNVDKYADSVDPCHHWINAQFTDHNGITQINAPLVAESPQIKALHKLLTDLNFIDKLIMFYASKGYFEYAFDTLNTIKRRQTKSEIFIRSIVFPSLVFQNWTSLWMKVRKMYDVDQTGNNTNNNNNNNNQMKSFVSDLFKFLHQRKMGNTAYNIQMSLHLYSMAFKTASDYFSEMKSWEGQMKIIDAMRKASKRDKETSKIMLAKIDFEENYIVKPCIENETPFIPGLNIMTTKENALKVAVFLMKKGEADTVMLKLLPMTLFTMTEMCHALLDDVMLSSETGAMHKLFLQIEKANLQNYEVIVMSLFQVINTRVADQRSLSQFIDENVRDYLKGRIFITFGFLDQAYDCAIKTKDNYLMELVRDNAERLCNKDLYQKAIEYLEK